MSAHDRDCLTGIHVEFALHVRQRTSAVCVGICMVFMFVGLVRRRSSRIPRLPSTDAISSTSLENERSGIFDLAVRLPASRMTILLVNFGILAHKIVLVNRILDCNVHRECPYIGARFPSLLQRAR